MSAPETEEARQARRQQEDAQLRDRMARIGRKVLVLSGKGGVGKSTVAAHLALALARAGRKVGLLDVDVHGPSVPKLLGLEGRPVRTDGREIEPVAAGENLAVLSIGFLLPGGGDPVIWRGPRKYGAIRQFLKDVVWGERDELVIDAPPGTGDEPLAVAQLVGPAAGAVIVTTPQDLAVADVRRCVAFCEALSLPVLGVIENMSGYVCPHCGARSDIFKSGGGEKLARETGVRFLGRIPIDPQVVVCGDEGRGLDEAGPAARAFGRIVEKLPGAAPQAAAAEAREGKDNQRMKIAIPLADGRLCTHFGHCETFALVEADAESRRILETSLHDPPAHEPGALPRWLGELGADQILAAGMGRRAQELFSRQGIRVVVGAPGGTPEQLVSAYLAGALETGENVCDH